MKRASFKPALEGDGTPVAALYVQTVNFTLPGSKRGVISPQFDRIVTVSRLPPGAWLPTTSIRQLFASDGTVEVCSVCKSSGSPQLDALACTAAPEPPVAFTDAAGTALRGVVGQSVMFVTADQAAKLGLR